MPHEMYYVKNKSRAERRKINLVHKHYNRMIKTMKKLRKVESQLQYQEPMLMPQVMRVVKAPRKAA